MNTHSRKASKNFHLLNHHTHRFVDSGTPLHFLQWKTGYSCRPLVLFTTEHARTYGNKKFRLGLMTTYLMESHKYVKVQHFCLSLKLQPNCSVVQGSKLSSTIYTECTLDTINISSIPTYTIEFKQLVKKDLTHNTPTKAFHF